ncbi:MAG: ArnT family glycosyltransferase [Candidatus Hodarchaeota archaeon]
MNRKILLFIFLFGFFVRLFFLLNTLPAADGLQYLTYARYVASMKVIPLGPTSYQLAEGKHIFRPILGKLLLALGFMVFNEVGAKIVLSVISSAVIFPMFFLINKLSSEITAIYSTLLWSVLPFEILYTSFAYIDGIMAFFGTIGLYFLTKIIFENKRNNDLIYGFLAGSFFGIALLIKVIAFGYLILTLILSFLLWKRVKPFPIKPLILLFTTTFMLSSWWYIRNKIFFGSIHGIPEVGNINNLNINLLLENLIGNFSEFNGFYVGAIVFNVYQTYPLFFYPWLCFAILHVFTFVLGYLIAYKKLFDKLKLLLLASFISFILILGRQQYYGITAIEMTQVRMLIPFIPIFLILPAKVIEEISAIQKTVKKISCLLLISTIILVILGTTYVNCLMRTKHNNYEVRTLQELDAIIPKESRILSSHRSGFLCYYLFPREILSIDFGLNRTLFEKDMYRALVDSNVSYIYYSNQLSPQFTKEIFLNDPRFEVMYFTTTKRIGFFGGETGIYEAWLFELK